MKLSVDINDLTNLNQLSEVDKTKLVSAIKRLNQRKRELEHQGLTRTDAYKNLDAFTRSLPHNTTIDPKTGEARTYAKQSFKGITLANVRRIMAVDRNKGTTVRGVLNKAMDVAREMGHDMPTRLTDLTPKQRATLRGIANTQGDLHDFIIHHTEAYYGIPEMVNAVRRGKPNATLTASEVAFFIDLMDKYNAGEEQAKAQAETWLKQGEYE